MSGVRLAVLSLMAALAAAAVLAPSASAAIGFEWKVNGSKLEAGHSIEFTVNNDSKKFDLSGEVGLAKSLLLSSNVSVEPGAKIIGGKPGKNEETAVFKEVTSDKPANCTISQNGVVGNVKTSALETEIVEGAAGGVGNNEVDILFRPKTGTTFATFEYTGSGCSLKGDVFPMTGTVLALALPQKSEVLKQNLVFEAVTKEYRNSAGEFKKAKLELVKEPAALSGLTLVILNSDQVFGPF